MSRRTQLVRLTGSSVALLVAAVFASEFSRMQLNSFINLAGYGLSDLPMVCIAFARFSYLLLLVAPAVFGLGLAAVSRDSSPSVRVEIFSTCAWVLSLLVVVTCLLAWQLPYYSPVPELG